MRSSNFFFKKIVAFFLNEKNYNKVKSNKIILDIVRKKDYDDIYSLISKIIDPEGSIVDIGANMGQCSGRFSRTLPGTRIFSVEPIKENYDALNDMIKKLRLHNVRSFNIGISDNDGVCEITIPILKGVVVSTQASIEKLSIFEGDDVTVRKVNINVLKLETFIRENKIDRITLIKIDTEGHDYTVLNSGREAILKNKPTIKMEGTWDSPEINWLYANGYEAFQIKDKKLVRVKTSKDPELRGDSILVHKEKMNSIKDFISN